MSDNTTPRPGERVALTERQFHVVWTEAAGRDGYHKPLFQEVLTALKEKGLVSNPPPGAPSPRVKPWRVAGGYYVFMTDAEYAAYAALEQRVRDSGFAQQPPPAQKADRRRAVAQKGHGVNRD